LVLVRDLQPQQQPQHHYMPMVLQLLQLLVVEKRQGRLLLVESHPLP
jgi:hypothetical protein